MNRKIIVALIIIVLIILAGILVFSHSNAQTDTEITFLSNNSLNNNDSVDFVLKDAQGNPLAGKNLTILFTHNGESEKYSVITDSEGKGSLVLNDEEQGSYSISVSFAGDEKYNKCSADVTITIGEATSQNGGSNATGSTSSASANDASASASSSSSSSSSSSNLNYDSDLNIYYDSSGNIVGGQNDGASYESIKNSPQSVDEEGNLV